MGFWILIILFIGPGVGCLVWLPRGRKVAAVEPRCAACGYIVHGLPAPVCPECGSDLSRPNAIMRSSRLPPGRLARALGWSLFCLLAVTVPLGMTWEQFARPNLPMVWNGSTVVTLSYPASQAYLSIELRARSNRKVYPNTPAPPPDDLKIQLTRLDKTTRQLAVDPATLRFRDTSSAQKQWSADPLDADALIAWLQSAGVQGKSQDLQIEMRLVMTQIRQAITSRQTISIPAGTGFSGVGSSSGGSMSPLPWVSLVPLAVSAIVWSIGLLRIFLSRPLSSDSDGAT